MINDDIRALNRRITSAATEDGSVKLSDIIMSMSLTYVGMCLSFREEGVTEDQVMEAAHRLIDLSKTIIDMMMEKSNEQA
jgi:hypothetical protein